MGGQPRRAGDRRPERHLHDFTHLIVDVADYAGSDLAGTRITKILQFAGVSLVNADGSTTGAAATHCA